MKAIRKYYPDGTPACYYAVTHRRVNGFWGGVACLDKPDSEGRFMRVKTVQDTGVWKSRSTARRHAKKALAWHIVSHYGFWTEKDEVTL